MSDSPFRAGFGKTPPLLAGRDDLIAEYSRDTEFGTWGLARSVLITGFRGVGKTVAINALEDVARSRGWEVVSETASAGFYDRMLKTHLPRILNALSPTDSIRVTGVAVAGFSVTLTYQDGRQVEETFRSMATRICELLEPRQAGLVFTLDEIGESSQGDLAAFASELQHLVREDREVSFVGAGLHSGVARLLKNKSITFVRRSFPAVLDLLSVNETRQALNQPVRKRGRHFEDDALTYAVAATQGYPFLVQDIGDRAWKANSSDPAIRLNDVKDAFAKSRRSMGAYILEPSLNELSRGDRTVLAAMAHDEGPSAVSDLRRRLGVDTKWLSVYRHRLINAGVVYAAGRGRLDIAMPYLRDYLREHIVADAASDIARARQGFPPPPPLG